MECVAAPINALTASQNVLDCFWNLAAPEEDKRLLAAEALVAELTARQADHVASLGGHEACETAAAAAVEAAGGADLASLPKPKRQEVALRRCSPLMIYALRRLARGLGSARAGARQGFATALALLLSRQVPGAAAAAAAPAKGAKGGKDAAAAAAACGLFVDAADVLVMLDTCLETSHAMKAGDARDLLVGRLFGLCSLIRSGLLSLPAPGAAAAADAPPASSKKAKKGAAASDASALLWPTPAGEVARALLVLSESKSFLREASADALAQLLGVLGPAGARALLAHETAGAELRAALSTPRRDATAEHLTLALFTWPILEGDVLSACSVLPPGAPAPALSSSFPESGVNGSVDPSRAAVAAALFTPAYLKSVLPALQGTISSNPRLHSIWGRLLPLLLPSMGEGGAPGGASMGQVEAFWSVVVEQGLLSSPSHERKFLAFRLFQAVLPHLGPDHVPVVFSRNFCKVLLNNIRKSDNYLHAAAKRCMDTVVAFAEGSSGDGSTRLAVAAALQRLGRGAAGDAGVSALGAKGAGLIANLDAEGVSKYVSHMFASFTSAGQARGVDASADAAATAAKAVVAAKAGAKAKPEDDGSAEAQVQADAGTEAQRSYAIEQLVAAARLPAARQSDVDAVLRFLATHALLEVKPDATAATPSKKKSKKGKAVDEDAEEGASGEGSDELTSASRLPSPLSLRTRRLCAQRLVTLIGALSPHKQQAREKAAATAAATAALLAPGKETAPGTKEQAPGAKKAKADAAATAAAEVSAAARAHPLVDGPAAVSALLGFLHATAAVAGGKGGKAPAGLRVTLAAGLQPEQEVALALLRETEGAVADAVAAAAQVEGHGTAADREAAASRRALLHVLRLLQVAVLGDPEGAGEPELAEGLRRMACEGLGAQLAEMEVEGEKSGSDSEDEDGPAPVVPWQDILVDVSLSLLSRPASVLPSAPFREAVEALWRGLAGQVTEQGMRDLVRVIVAGREDEDVLGADEDDGDEDEEEVEQDEEESEAEAEEESGKKGKKGEKKGGKKAAPVAEASDDEDEKDKDGSSDSDDEKESEGADDADMFRMDAKMAAYLRGMVDQRKGAKERRVALASLRLRALTLVEAYAKKVPSSGLLALAPAPLARALCVARHQCSGAGSSAAAGAQAGKASKPGSATLAKDSSDLASRLSAVLKGLCGRNRAAPAAALAMPLEELESSLKRALFMASREKDRAAAQAAGLAWGYLLRVASACTGPDAESAKALAAASFKAGLLDMVDKKKSRIHRSTLEEAAHAAPAAAMPSMPELLRACVSASNTYKQAEAMTLLAAVMRPPQGKAAREAAESGDDEATTELSSALRANGPALGAALAATAAGTGMRKDQHAGSLKAGVSVVEGVRRLFKGKRLYDVIGADGINALAKAVATVSSLGAQPKVVAQLGRLTAAAAITDLAAKLGPDAALKAKLVKAREKAEAAAAIAQASADANAAAKRKERREAQQAGGDKGGKKRKQREEGSKGGGGVVVIDSKDGGEQKAKDDKKESEAAKAKASSRAKQEANRDSKGAGKGSKGGDKAVKAGKEGEAGKEGKEGKSPKRSAEEEGGPKAKKAKGVDGDEGGKKAKKSDGAEGGKAKGKKEKPAANEGGAVHKSKKSKQ
ncbi:hypothetical protein FOA52_010407 [Chlamydomonas sp. UWO 241]|nr:hypothetical protein FOA52_010407 [Chlamydomonas sp. UWO 241]